MKKIILSVLFSAFIFSSATAQTVTVYDAFDAKQTIDPKNKKEEKNYLQWNLSLLGRGAFVFEYERKINNYLGIQVGA